jgi:hypothetical protein
MLDCRDVPFLAALAALVSAVPSPACAQDVVTDIGQVRMEVGDLRRFSQTIRLIQSEGAHDTAAVIDRHYMSSASPGLRAYAQNYAVTAEEIASAISRDPAVYSGLDSLTEAILAQEETFRAAFGRLQQLYPNAAFPPIWFIVGSQGPGGLTRPEGVLIAAERFVERPRDLVPMVLHELAHFQQVVAQGIEVYRRLYGPAQTLLGLAIREGSAELIAELTTGQHINPAAEEYGTVHERELWCQFREDMHGSDTKDWMFERPVETGKPSDLGYWIGYRIARRYFDRADDKQEAIVDILTVTDFGAFLDASGYSAEVICSPQGAA